MSVQSLVEMILNESRDVQSTRYAERTSFAFQVSVPLIERFSVASSAIIIYDHSMSNTWLATSSDVYAQSLRSTTRYALLSSICTHKSQGDVSLLDRTYMGYCLREHSLRDELITSL